MHILNTESIGKALVTSGLVYQLFAYGGLAGYSLRKYAVRVPMPKGKKDKWEWWKVLLSQHQWHLIFLVINAFIFWVSFESGTDTTPMKALGEWLIAGQILIMTIAAELVKEWNTITPVVSMERHPIRWSFALLLPILMNLVATLHTAERASKHSAVKTVLWYVMVALAVLFYLIVLFILHFQTKRLKPPGLVFLWPSVVIPLLVCIILDAVFLRTNESDPKPLDSPKPVAYQVNY